MTSTLEPLLKAYAFNLSYARQLVIDISDKHLYQSFGQGIENHPAFTLGHLSIAAALVAERLGRKYDIPQGWDELFRRKGPGDPRRPLPYRDGMPGKMDLLSELERQHSRVADRVDRLTHEELSGSVEWRLNRQFPTLADYLVFMCVTHEAMHLGQLAAWRRAAGMESALARL